MFFGDKENDTCNNASGCKSGWQHGHPKCDKGYIHIVRFHNY